jgi:hypothetical protein
MSTTTTSAVDLLKALSEKVLKATKAVDLQISSLKISQHTLRLSRIELNRTIREEQRIMEVETTEANLIAADAAVQAKIAQELAQKEAEEKAVILAAITSSDIAATLTAAAEAISTSTQVLNAAVTETKEEGEKTNNEVLSSSSSSDEIPIEIKNVTGINTPKESSTPPPLPKGPVIPEISWDRAFSLTPPSYIFSINVQPPLPIPTTEESSKKSDKKNVVPLVIVPQLLTIGVSKNSPLCGVSITMSRLSSARILSSYIRSGITAGLEVDMAEMATEELIEVLHTADDFALEDLVDSIKKILLSEE